MLVKFTQKDNTPIWIESSKVTTISFPYPYDFTMIEGYMGRVEYVTEGPKEVVDKINAANGKHFITLTDPAYTDMTYQIDADEVAYVGTIPSGLFEGGANIYTKSCGFFKAVETADKVMEMVQKATAGAKENR